MPTRIATVSTYFYKLPANFAVHVLASLRYFFWNCPCLPVNNFIDLFACGKSTAAKRKFVKSVTQMFRDKIANLLIKTKPKFPTFQVRMCRLRIAAVTHGGYKLVRNQK